MISRLRSSAIVVDDVTKSFPESYRVSAWLRHRGPPPRRIVLSNVSLQVGRGELFGVLGLNGAGKTTLLKLLCTLTLPDQGKIRIEGFDVVKQPVSVRGCIGFCQSDERSFYLRLTARENMELFGSLCGFKGRHLTRRIEKVIASVGLTDDIDRRYFAYSSGMKQRLAVARALIHDPPILILDEPTRAVDAKHARYIWLLLREFVDRSGKTIMLATNNVEEAWAICSRVAIIRGGRIVTIDSPHILTAKSTTNRHVEITVDRVTDDFMDSIKRVPGFLRCQTQIVTTGVLISIMMDNADSSLNHVLKALSVDGLAVKSIAVDPPRPMDIFGKLTSGA